MLHSKKWSWLKAWAMQIARRRGMKKAIVAIKVTVEAQALAPLYFSAATPAASRI